MVRTYFDKIHTTITAVFFLGLAVAACSPSEQPVCKFKKGEIVHSVLDGRKGQITARWQNNCKYRVRFAGDQDTQSRSWDVDTLPYAVVTMLEFELKR